MQQLEEIVGADTDYSDSVLVEDRAQASTLRNVSLLLLRLSVGGLLAGHGAQKLFGWFGGVAWNETWKILGPGGRGIRIWWRNPPPSWPVSPARSNQYAFRNDHGNSQGPLGQTDLDSRGWSRIARDEYSGGSGFATERAWTLL